MSTNLKIIIGLLVAVLIGSGAWWIVSIQPSGSVAINETNTTNNQNTPTTAPASQTTPAKTVTNSSDASIEADLGAIDAEINAMSSDATSVDQSLTQ